MKMKMKTTHRGQSVACERRSERNSDAIPQRIERLSCASDGSLSFKGLIWIATRHDVMVSCQDQHALFGIKRALTRLPFQPSRKTSSFGGRKAGPFSGSRSGRRRGDKRRRWGQTSRRPLALIFRMAGRTTFWRNASLDWVKRHPDKRRVAARSSLKRASGRTARRSSV